MVEGKRRCHSTSEAPFLVQPFKSASSDDAFCDEAAQEEYTSSGRTRLIPQTQRECCFVQSLLFVCVARGERETSKARRNQTNKI